MTDSTNPMECFEAAIKGKYEDRFWETSLNEVREQCRQATEQGLPEDALVRAIDDEEARRLLDDLLRIHIEQNAYEKAEERASKKLKNKVETLNLHLSEVYGLDPDGDWHVKPFHRAIVRRQGDDENDQDKFKMILAIYDAVDEFLNNSSVSAWESVLAGVLPEAVEEKGGDAAQQYFPFFKDLAKYLLISGEPGKQLASAIFGDARRAQLAHQADEDVVCKPLQFLAQIKLVNEKFAAAN